MNRALLAVVLLLLLPLPALGAGESYPTTLVDQGCTDSYDTPAAQGTANRIIEPAEQTSGSADTRCDHDSRILTGELDANTTFGPFRGGLSACYLVFADGNTVTGGGTQWGIIIQVEQPHNAELENVDAATLVTGVVDAVWLIGLPSGYAFDSLTESLNVRLSAEWYLFLDLNVATAWTGELSLVGC